MSKPRQTLRGKANCDILFKIGSIVDDTMSTDPRLATNLRMLLIMEAVSKSEAPMTPTEINRSIGLPKQSIHRLCQTLVDQGFLMRDVSGKRLQPTPRSLGMARGLLTSRQQNLARHQVLMNLSRATKETVNFVLPEADGMMYLDRVETDWIFRIELPIGSRVPFHCTASGKCYLASLDDKKLDSFLNIGNFEARTENTITDRATLEKELSAIRQRGYAIDNEELFEGMIALAVPVKNKMGGFQSAVAFHGPTQRLTPESLTDHLDTMREGAQQLAQLDTA